MCRPSCAKSCGILRHQDWLRFLLQFSSLRPQRSDKRSCTFSRTNRWAAFATVMIVGTTFSAPSISIIEVGHCQQLIESRSSDGHPQGRSPFHFLIHGRNRCGIKSRALIKRRIILFFFCGSNITLAKKLNNSPVNPPLFPRLSIRSIFKFYIQCSSPAKRQRAGEKSGLSRLRRIIF